MTAITLHFTAPGLVSSLPSRRVPGSRKAVSIRRAGAQSRSRDQLCRRALNDDNDVELAVFRFTLGIPGFDDALIPRVAGVIGIALLLLNHLLSGEAGSSQEVTEAVGVMLAGVGIAAPTLQKRIEDSKPGRGRRPAVENLEGASNTFAILENLTAEQKQEAAWASFAIIKNANVCGVFVSVRGVPVVCRGALGLRIGGTGVSEACLVNAQAAYAASALSADTTDYLETRGRIDASPVRNCDIIPSGAGGVVVLPIKPLDDGAPSIGSMVLVCDRERAMSTKEMAWCRSVGSKLYSALLHVN